MISYNWGSKEMAMKIKEGVEKGGYRVWIDQDRMYGDMNARMAEAVDGLHSKFSFLLFSFIFSSFLYFLTEYHH